MADEINQQRRKLVGVGATTFAIGQFGLIGRANAEPKATTVKLQSAASGRVAAFGALKHVDAGVLNIAYVEVGSADGPPVILLHGWPYDIHAFADVAPVLVANGFRVIIPYLRGYGATRFLSDQTMRNGQQATFLSEGEAKYDELEKKLATAPVISVPTITLEGDANGAPHLESNAYAKKFTGKYRHRLIKGGIGHNLPQEAPLAFASAIVDAAVL